MNDNKSGSAIISTGFCGLLTITFIVLKVLGVITWNWILVLAPMWIPAVLLFLLLSLLFIVNFFIGEE